MKKASDCRCTWPKTWVRRSKIRPSPIREENQPPTTREDGAEHAPRRHRERQLDDQRGVLGEDAVVDDALDQQRGDDHQAASTTVSTRKTAISRRCGRANDSTRRTVPRSSSAVGDAPVGAHVTPHLTHAAHA